MTLADAQLEYLKSKNVRNIDQTVGVFKHVMGEDHAIMFLARVSHALARMDGFTGETPDDLERFRNEKYSSHQRLVAECAASAPGTALARASFDIVPALSPNAFTVHVRADDSYAIGLDDSLAELINVLTLAAFAAFQSKDLDIYKRVCLNAFGLFYLTPNPSIIGDLEQLAMMYTQSAEPIRRLMDDVSAMGVRFVLSHEAGHLALDHFDSRPASHLSFDEGVEDSDVSAFNDKSTEFEADMWALEHMASSTRGDPRRQHAAIQTPPLVLTMLHHIGTLAEGVAILGSVMRSGHPPEVDRRANIRARSEELGAEHGVEVDLVQEMGDFLAALDSPLSANRREDLLGTMNPLWRPPTD